MSEKKMWMYCLYILYILKQRDMCMKSRKRNEKSKALVAMVCKMKKKLYFTIRVLYFKCSLEEHFAKA